MDLTSSVYSIIVLTYATLATTSYLFNSIETKAGASHLALGALKDGRCSFIWKQQSVSAPDQEDPSVKARNEYDVVTSAKNKDIKRWDWLQLYLFGSVLGASLLQLLVLLSKIQVIAADSWTSSFVVGLLVIEQAVATAAVPLVGVNVLIMRRRLRRVERLVGQLETYATIRGASG